MQDANTDLVAWPKQPELGTFGDKVRLEANYFSLALPAEPKVPVLYRYDITVDPPTQKTTEKTGGRANIDRKSASQAYYTAQGSKGKNPSRVIASAGAAPEASGSDRDKAPSPPTGRKLKQVIKLFLKRAPEIKKRKDEVFTDFKAVLYSSFKLQADPFDYCVDYVSEHVNMQPAANMQPASNKQPDGTTYMVHLRITASLDLSDLSAALQRDAFKMDMIQALNILFLFPGRARADFLTIGDRRSFQMSTFRQELGHCLAALRGYFSSVHVVNSRILLNVNVTHGAFYHPIEGDDLTNTISKYIKNGEWSKVDDKDRKSLSALLRGLQVQLTHLANDPKKSSPKTIVGLAMPRDGELKQGENTPEDYHKVLVEKQGGNAKEVKFWHKKCEKRPFSIKLPENYVTVYDFYKKKYERALSDEWPVINVGSSRFPIYVGAELCRVLPGQPFRGKLSSGHTENMVKTACMESGDSRMAIFDDGLDNFGLGKEKSAQVLSLRIQANAELERVDARRLGTPKIIYKDEKSAQILMDGKWNMMDRQFWEGSTLQRWSWVNIFHKVGPDESDQNFGRVSEAVQRFTNTVKKSGVVCTNAIAPWSKALGENMGEDVFNGLKRAVDPGWNLDLLLVVLPKKNVRLYNLIKRFGDIDLGIKTVCVVRDKFCRTGPLGIRYWANVALKINLKLGGTNQRLNTNSENTTKVPEKTMVVGVDVTHPSPGSESDCPSVAAMVASVKEDLGQWPATLSLQYIRELAAAQQKETERELDPKQEMVSEIGEMLESRLKLWQSQEANNHSLPENILVYRDGVSEGQYQAVLKRELNTMKAKCKELYPGGKQPKFTLIVATKRHHTRFFNKGPAPEKTQSNTPVERGSSDPVQNSGPVAEKTPGAGRGRDTMARSGPGPTPGRGPSSVQSGGHGPMGMRNQNSTERRSQGPEKSRGNFPEAGRGQSQGHTKQGDQAPEQPAKEPANDYGNPDHGSVVDNGITKDFIWNFFLQSHTPMEGTARPAHYVVLANEIFTDENCPEGVANTVESITYNLCWLYGRTTRPVSYCTPAYYADRACDRARCYLDEYFTRDVARSGDLEAASSERIKINSRLGTIICSTYETDAEG